MDKRITLALFAVALFAGVHCLPPILTIGWQGAARTPITIMKLALNTVPSLIYCPDGSAPTTRSFSGWDECANKCPSYCGSISNCNATCVMEGRCVCGASQYCLINREVVNPDNSYGVDCFSLE